MSKIDKMQEEMRNEKISEIIKEIEETKDRRDEILRYVEEALEIECEKHKYGTGTNLIATIGKKPFVGIGSHFDVVAGSPGANDNASAVAVAIDVLRKLKKNPLKNIGVKAFFFDEEENELIGSRAYVRERGIEDLIGFYNMEMVGFGENLAFWTENSLHEGRLLRTIETCAQRQGVRTYRFQDIRRFLENSGDQESFIETGLKEAFCTTAISDADIERVNRYFSTKHKGGMQLEEFELQFESDLFRHYHQPTDTLEHLSDKTLQMVSNVLYGAVCEIDRNSRGLRS